MRGGSKLYFCLWFTSHLENHEFMSQNGYIERIEGIHLISLCWNKFLWYTIFYFCFLVEERVGRIYHNLLNFCDTQTCCRTFGSRAITTCFNEICLSRQGIEPWSSASNQRSNRGGSMCKNRTSKHLLTKKSSVIFQCLNMCV